MGQIMGMGSSHWPAMIQPDEAKPWPFLRTLAHDPRVPAELKYRGSAAESMLTLRQPAKAKQFAEAGLAEAIKQQNRDMEAYFRELVAAAKKQGG